MSNKTLFKFNKSNIDSSKEDEKQLLSILE